MNVATAKSYSPVKANWSGTRGLILGSSLTIVTTARNHSPPNLNKSRIPGFTQGRNHTRVVSVENLLQLIRHRRITDEAILERSLTTVSSVWLALPLTLLGIPTYAYTLGRGATNVRIVTSHFYTNISLSSMNISIRSTLCEHCINTG